ncbi:MAG: hypothetical protein AAFV53_04935 [Myxococcota bacterium]
MILLLLATALAGPPGHVDLAPVTDFPILVGASGAWESPSRFRLEATAGIFPDPYVSAVNTGLTTFDVYSDTTAELIDVVLQNALVLHGQVGFIPWENSGLSVSLGYQYIGFAGDTTDVLLFADAAIPSDVLEAAEQATGDLEVDLQSHMISGEIGYQWLIKERLVIRSSVGFAYTIHANTAVSATRDPNTPAEEEALELVNDAAADYLNFVFEEWVHLPTVGISAGYRFF